MSEPKRIEVPGFTRRPPAQDLIQPWQLYRVKTGRPQRMFVIGHDAVFSPTHYSGGRTRQCNGDGCEICATGKMPRWYGFLAMATTSMSERFILEFPARCCEVIERYFSQHRSLRGAELTISRVNKRENSRVHMELKETQIARELIPESFNVPLALARIWEVKLVTVMGENGVHRLKLKSTGTDSAAPLPGQGTFLD